MLDKAEEKDLNEVFRLICILEEGKEPAFVGFKEAYLEMLKDTDRYILLTYKEDEKIIGFLDMRIEKQLHHGQEVAEILELVVNPEYRSKKIGQSLFDEACKIAKNRNCQLVEVSSSIRRKRAHQFYLKNGMIQDHYSFSKYF